MLTGECVPVGMANGRMKKIGRREWLVPFRQLQPTKEFNHKHLCTKYFLSGKSESLFSIHSTFATHTHTHTSGSHILDILICDLPNEIIFAAKHEQISNDKPSTYVLIIAQNDDIVAAGDNRGEKNG